MNLTFDERLVAVGTGIRTVGQITGEALAWIKRADKVLYVLSDPVSERLIHDLNPTGAESLQHFYVENKVRREIYEQMIQLTLGYVRSGRVVCLAVYGHPGVFAFPTHESIRRARAEGYKARMLPGVSAEDCLFADFNIDPGSAGCQSYEATDFLVNRRITDPSSHLILWQMIVLGDSTYRWQVDSPPAMRQFIDRLTQQYPPDHVVYVYEASIFPGVEAHIEPVTIANLGRVRYTTMSTLYVPPCVPPRADLQLYQALGIPLG